jgi:hypothetical protein
MAVTDGEVIKAVAEFVLSDGTIGQNVFHFIANFLTDETNTAVRDACIDYIEDIYNSVSTYLSDGFTVNPSTVHRVAWNETEDEWETETLLGIATPSITHTNTDDEFPNQISPVLVANTTRPKSRGRKFLMGFVETAAVAGDLVGAAITALTTALNHYLADETVTGSNVLSPGVPRAGVNTFLEFADGAVNSVVGTMRTRKPGVGG